MNAQELRKKKILTTREFRRIIHELAPVVIKKEDDEYYSITDSTGFKTSHLYLRDLIEKLIPISKHFLRVFPKLIFLDENNHGEFFIESDTDWRIK